MRLIFTKTKLHLHFLFALFLALLPLPAAAELVILAADGSFLGWVGTEGRLCNQYRLDCVFNEHGRYGSPDRRTIFNDRSRYGSEYGRESVCNLNASNEDTPALYLVEEEWTAFFDNISPDSRSDIGFYLYLLACLR